MAARGAAAAVTEAADVVAVVRLPHSLPFIRVGTGSSSSGRGGGEAAPSPLSPSSAVAQGAVAEAVGSDPAAAAAEAAGTLLHKT